MVERNKVCQGERHEHPKVAGPSHVWSHRKPARSGIELRATALVRNSRVLCCTTILNVPDDCATESPCHTLFARTIPVLLTVKESILMGGCEWPRLNGIFDTVFKHNVDFKS